VRERKRERELLIPMDLILQGIPTDPGLSDRRERERERSPIIVI
jgi:hypothetical protein